MSVLSERLEAAATIGQVAEALRTEWETERVSIARFDHGHATFEIVGWSGKPLFAPGLEVPVDLSTQMLASAHGETYVAARFADDPVWPRPIDEFMLGIGFECGCSLALGAPDHPVGAVSLTSTAPGRTFD